MKAKKNRTRINLILDVGLAAAFVIALKPFATGLVIHEWLGLAVGVALLAHLFLHWRWVVGITSKFFGRLPLKTRAYYTLDAGLLLSFVTIIVSGVMMSRVVLVALGLPRTFSEEIVVVHKLSSIVTAILVVAKLALHWSWIKNAFLHRSTPQLKLRPAHSARPAPSASSALAMATVPVESKLATTKVDRRRFLVLGGGVAALAFLTGRFGNVVTLGDQDSTTASSVDVDASSDVAQDSVETSSVDTNVSLNVADDSAEISSVDTEATEDVVATLAPESTQENAASTSPSVPTRRSRDNSTALSRCPHGLVDDPYPGRCHHYVDSNGNGYCDYSQVS